MTNFKTKIYLCEKCGTHQSALSNIEIDPYCPLCSPKGFKFKIKEIEPEERIIVWGLLK